jgi:hypothetical protein
LYALDPLWAELKAYREAGDRIKTAETLNKIGDVFDWVNVTAGYLDGSAISSYTGALLIWYELEDQVKVTETRGKLRCLWEARQEKCITHFTDTLDEARIQENRLWEAVMLNELGVIYEGQGLSDLASEYFQQALVIAREIDNPVLDMEASRVVEGPKATITSMPAQTSGRTEMSTPTPTPTSTITPTPMATR